MYGTDYEYAGSRLTDSIVRIDKTGEPVLINAVGLDGTVLVTFLRDRDSRYVKLDDLNVKPVPLGWCNYEGNASYLCRIPKRRDWKQGVRAETMFSSTVRYRNIPSKYVHNCIMGVYPRLGDIKFSKGHITAWSRKWASDGKSVFFANLGEVGEMVDGMPQLKEEFVYLKESLEKSLS